MTTWQPDLLGDGWSQQEIPLRPDRLSGTLGPARATLIHRDPDGAAPRRAVLAVHGWCDYFFHPHVGETFAAAGWDFFALELRGYGRSIREGEEPNQVEDLSTYAEEIDKAITLLRADHDEIVLLGHSMGGLVSSLWADARPGRITALVLNSPWLQLRGGWFDKTVLTAAVAALARVAPQLPVSRLDPYYGKALHTTSGGEWDYDLRWKPHDGFPIRAGWVSAIRRGHAKIRRGLDITVPVLVMTSDATGPTDVEHPGLVTSDCVLDVADMHRRAPHLGKDVTVQVIPLGAHDLALSPEPARSRYLQDVLTWLDER